MDLIRRAFAASAEQSGLFKYLLPLFTAKTGVEVRVVAVGTGQALDMARRGDADALFVHDQPAEEKFVAEGFGLERRAVMYNDFVLIGPKADPAGTRGSHIAAALNRLARAPVRAFLALLRSDAARAALRELGFRVDPGG